MAVKVEKRSPVLGVDVISVGTPVTIGADVAAIVTGILIRDKFHVTYECSWWNGADHNCKWLEVQEVRACDAPRVRVGFAGMN